MKRLLIIFLTLMMILTSSMAFASINNHDATNVVVDSLVLRPLGFAATVFGSIIFVISLPIAAITKSVDETAKVLVEEPFKYTFVRPIGKIESGL
jgi:hypothetical protein